MPTLKQIKCSVELGPGNVQLKEYGSKYNDGSVQTFIAVPDTDIPFTIHIETQGYIAPGIALFVFMDGEYQCNRNRVGLKLPGPGVDPSQYETDFRLRQKEEKTAYGSFVSRAWSFKKLQIDAADKAPALNPQFLKNLGSIEVVALRCRQTPGPNSVVEPSINNKRRLHCREAHDANLDGAAESRLPVTDGAAERNDNNEHLNYPKDRESFGPMSFVQNPPPEIDADLEGNLGSYLWAEENNLYSRQELYTRLRSGLKSHCGVTLYLKDAVSGVTSNITFCKPPSEAICAGAGRQALPGGSLAGNRKPKFPESFPSTLYDPNDIANLHRIARELGEMPEIDRPDPRCSQKLYIAAENLRAEIESSVGHSNQNNTTHQELNLILLETELEYALAREAISARILLGNHIISQAERLRWFHENASQFKMPSHPSCLRDVEEALSQTLDEAVKVSRELDADFQDHAPPLKYDDRDVSGGCNLDGVADDPYGARGGQGHRVQFLNRGTSQPVDFNDPEVLKAYAEADGGIVGNAHGFQQVGQGTYDPRVQYGGYPPSPVPMVQHPIYMQQTPVVYAQPGHGYAHPYGDIDQSEQVGLMDSPYILQRRQLDRGHRPEGAHAGYDSAPVYRNNGGTESDVLRWPPTPNKTAGGKTAKGQVFGACWGDNAQGYQPRRSKAVEAFFRNRKLKSNISDAGSKSSFRHGWDSKHHGRQSEPGNGSKDQKALQAKKNDAPRDQAGQNENAAQEAGGVAEAKEGGWSDDKGGTNNNGMWDQRPADNEQGNGWAAQGGDKSGAPAWDQQSKSKDNANSEANAGWAAQTGGNDYWGKTCGENDKQSQSSKTVSNANGQSGWVQEPQNNDQSVGWGNNQSGGGWGGGGGSNHNANTGWGNASARGQNSGSKASGTSVRPSASISSAGSGRSHAADPKSFMKPYWKDWQKPFSKIEGLVPGSTPHAEPRPVLQYPEHPIPIVPSGKAKSASYGVQAGKGSDYAHLCRRPMYIDSMEAPYAVFSFNYRSKEALEKILKIQIDDGAIEKVRKQVEKATLLHLPKQQLVEELLASRK